MTDQPKTYRLRFLKPEGFYAAGDVITPEWPVAQLYLERGVCEEVPEPDPEPLADREDKMARLGRGKVRAK